MSNTTPSPAPIAVGPGEGEALWFVGTLAIVKASGATTGGRMAVVDQLAARGAGSPLHVHRREDEWFYVTEGELAFWVGGSRIAAPAGAFVYGPRDVPHTFEVVSERARFLLVAEPAGFEDFMRAAGGARRRPHDPAAALRAARPRPLARAGGRARRRDPRPARDPGLSRPPAAAAQAAAWATSTSRASDAPTSARIASSRADSSSGIVTRTATSQPPGAGESVHSWTMSERRQEITMAPSRPAATDVGMGKSGQPSR